MESGTLNQYSHYFILKERYEKNTLTPTPSSILFFILFECPLIYVLPLSLNEYLEFSPVHHKCVVFPHACLIGMSRGARVDGKRSGIKAREVGAERKTLE